MLQGAFDTAVLERTGLKRLLSGYRIGLLTASASRLGGGVSEAVLVQAGLIRAQGGDPIIFALDDDATAEDRDRYASVPLVVSRVCGPRQIGFAPDLFPRLMAAGLDCLHLHGIWTYPSRAAVKWARKTGRAYVVSPHAMLSQWVLDRGRWKKAIAKLGYETASWNAATVFHALTERERYDIERATGHSNIIVIPNAGHPATSDRSAIPGPQILFISRIHPIKNIPPMIEAWSTLDRAGQLPVGAQLTLAGWGDPADVSMLQQLLSKAPASIRFIGPCYGNDKVREMRASRFVILPSLREGLPMTVLDAWAAGIPSIMNQESGLTEGFAVGAALDCGFDKRTLQNALINALSMPENEWLAMSKAALGLARSTFSGQRVSALWSDVYTKAIQYRAGVVV